MGEGWVKIHRELQQHPVWSHDGMLKLWMHCIFEANYKSSTYLVPGTTETIEVPRGSFVTGREKLRSSLYPSTNADTPVSRTIYRWLESLEKMGCVTLVTVSHRCTVVSVCNYDTYQSSEPGQCPSDVQPMSKSCPTDVPPVSTSEEGKKVIKEEGKNINKSIPSVDEVRAYCVERKNKIDPELFVDHYTAKGWLVGRTKMKDWKAAVRTWEKTSIPTGNPKKQQGTRLPTPEEDANWTAYGNYDEG